MQTAWSMLRAAELARLRYSLMRELAWIEWDGRPDWWWRLTYATLLEVKQSTPAPPPAGCPDPDRPRGDLL